MRQRKFTIWLIAAIFSAFGLFFANAAVAELIPPKSCNTFTGLLPNGNPDLGNINSNPIVSIDNTFGKWPIVFEKASDDTQNYCDNTVASNYPCSVFKYTVDQKSVNYQKTIITIPTCLDNSLDISTKYVAESACSRNDSQGNPDWASFACGMRDIRLNNNAQFHIPVKGGNVGTGVISLTLVSNNTTPNTNYYCYNTVSNTGILGPACGVKILAQESTCAPSSSSATTTNFCLSNVAGNTVKLDTENDAITAVYTCSDPNCATGCTQRETYEALADIEICDLTGANCVQTGKRCRINEMGDPDCEVIMHAGGTSEESIGYFVVSDASGTTICLIAQANTICFNQ